MSFVWHFQGGGGLVPDTNARESIPRRRLDHAARGGAIDCERSIVPQPKQRRSPGIDRNHTAIRLARESRAPSPAKDRTILEKRRGAILARSHIDRTLRGFH